MSVNNGEKYQSHFQKLVGGIVSLLVLVALVLTAVRLLITPAYLVFEYNTPGFPADPYGFSKTERLYWARFAVNYLVNDAGIEYLGELRFPDGQQVPPLSCQFMADCTRLYNERELKHMLDVKLVVQGALRVWVGSLLGLVLFGIVARMKGWELSFRQALVRGGWLTLVLISGIILFVALAFGVIFVWFHQIFFETGTWVFYYSDTLIRLFPERFWRDTFIWVGVLSGGAGILLALLLREKRRN